MGPARVQALRQRGERHDAALAVVVGAHQHADVLHGDDEGDRPEHQGDDTVDIRHGRPDRAVVDREHGLQRVQRAGADVAEHHAQRGEHQARTCGVAQLVARFGGVVRRRRGGRRGGGAAHGLPSVEGRACSGPPRSRSSTTPAAGALPQDCPSGRTLNPVGGGTRRTGEEPARRCCPAGRWPAAAGQPRLSAARRRLSCRMTAAWRRRSGSVRCAAPLLAPLRRSALRSSSMRASSPISSRTVGPARCSMRGLSWCGSGWAARAVPARPPVGPHPLTLGRADERRL